jgi:hypothetical protein
MSGTPRSIDKILAIDLVDQKHSIHFWNNRIAQDEDRHHLKLRFSISQNWDAVSHFPSVSLRLPTATLISPQFLDSLNIF